MSNVEVEPYRSSVSGHRALFAFGLTQDFFSEDRSKNPGDHGGARLGRSPDLEQRFGVRSSGRSTTTR